MDLKLFNRNKKIKKFGKIKEDELIISICDPKRELCEIIAKKFEKEKQVEIINGDIFREKADGLVSPSNSFGDMGGGIDKLIDEYYDNKAQEKVVNTIRKNYYGEISVGSAFILKMESKKFPYLIISPTMRIPGSLRKDTINIYLSMRATLLEVVKFNLEHKGEIKKLIMSGLGTGIGGLSYEESASQMYSAYENICLGKWKDVKHPMIAPYVMRKQ